MMCLTDDAANGFNSLNLDEGGCAAFYYPIRFLTFTILFSRTAAVLLQQL
jgi:hypothetical protein